MKSNIFETLDKIDVSTHTEKKGQFNYLSWAWAVRELLRVAPEATWTVHEWGLEGNKQPYMQTEAGCFVKVSVSVNNIVREQVHPACFPSKYIYTKMSSESNSSTWFRIVYICWRRFTRY
jgi:hypothetical protein